MTAYHHGHTKQQTGSASTSLRAGLMGTPSSWLILNGIGVHTGLKRLEQHTSNPIKHHQTSSDQILGSAVPVASGSIIL